MVSRIIILFFASCNLLGQTTTRNWNEEAEIDIDIAALNNLRQEAARLNAHSEHWLNTESVQGLFKKFTSLYKRDYVSDRKEYEFRQGIFMESLKRHAHLNQEEMKSGSEAVFGINKFSDWSQEEFKKMLGAYSSSSPMNLNTQSNKVSEFKEGSRADSNDCSYYIEDPPKSVDWRKKGKVTAVKNQGKCGSCWAFVAVEQVESYWAMNGKPLNDFSVQEFISCAPSLGCNGGNTCQALAWLAFASQNKTRYRLVHASEYPYESKETPCKYSKTSETGATINGVCGCHSLVGREDVMLKVLAQRGPLGINVNAILWHDYVGGIIQRHCSNLTMNHAVQIVGYDLSGPVPYWNIRNTWGRDFGENGYIRVKYGGNLCGLAEEPSFVYI